MGSNLLRGKSNAFNVLSKATFSKLSKMRHEEGPTGGDRGEEQLSDDRGNTCG